MEKKLEMGAYRVFDRANGASFVGYSLNLAGTLKRLRFELTLNACSYRPLQQFFSAAAEPDMEILEVYSPKPDESDEEAEAHVRALAFVWQTKLYNAELIQTPITL